MLDYGSYPIAKWIGENTYAQVSLSVHCAAKRSSDFVEIVLDGRNGRAIGLPDRIEQDAFGRSIKVREAGSQFGRSVDAEFQSGQSSDTAGNGLASPSCIKAAICHFEPPEVLDEIFEAEDDEILFRAAKKTGIETRLTIGFIGFGPAKHLNPAESSIRRFATEGR